MTVKNKSKIIAVITALFIAIAFMPVCTSGVYANTTDDSGVVYEPLDDTYHCYTDSSGEIIKEEHNWSRGSSCEYFNYSDHTVTYTCDKCGATQTREESHHFVKGPSEWSVEEDDDHYVACYGPTFTCECGAKGECDIDFGHMWEDLYVDYDDDDREVKEYNAKYHCVVTESCYNCEAVRGPLVRHKGYKDYTKIDAKYHNVEEVCYDCDVVSTKKEKHSKATTKVVRKATLKTKGKVRDICKCGAVLKTRAVPWKYNTKYSVSYNVTWNTYVYRNSKHVTVTLKNPIKGATVVVQIGKKKYKKIAGKGRKVTVKIKKPKKYGSKIYIDVLYKGKWIGEASYYDTVYYAKGIKKGMTKNQFKHTRYYWGAPDDTASASGGWSYWYYDDGSYIGFKNGKIRFWYNAD